MDFQFELWPSETDDAPDFSPEPSSSPVPATVPTAKPIGFEVAYPIRSRRAWGDGVAERRSALVRDLRGELDTVDDIQATNLLRTILDIAEGGTPCPLQWVPDHQMHVPSHRAICLIAGLNPSTVRRNDVLCDLADRFVGRLEMPGCKVDVVAGEPVVRYDVELAVAKALDHLELTGGRIPAHPEKPKYGSRKAFCEEHGIEFEALQSCLSAQRHFIIATRLDGSLGPAIDLDSRRKKMERQVQKAIDWFDEQERLGTPLPVDPERPDQPCDRSIAALVDPDGPALTHSVVYKRRRDHHVAKFGLEKVITEKRFDTVGAFREWSGESVDEKGRVFWSANCKSSFKRLLAAYELEEADSVRPLLEDDETTLCAKAVAAGRKRKAAGEANLRSDVRKIRRMLIEYASSVGNLPVDPREALAVAIDRSGKSRDQVAREAGVPAATLTNYINGANPISKLHRDKLERIDQAVGAGGLLAPRLKVSKKTIYRDGSEFLRNLPHRVRRHLTDEDLRLGDDHLAMRAEEIRTKVECQDRPFSRAQRNRRKFWMDVPPAPHDCPIFEEADLIVQHKQDIDPDLLRRTNGTWENDTAEIFRSCVCSFARYAFLARDKGGLGLSADRISFALLLNRKVFLAYLNFRTTLPVDPDEEVPLLPILTAFDLNFVHHVRTLTHPQYGFITQRPDLFLDRIEVDDVPLGDCYSLDSIRIRKFEFEELGEAASGDKYATKPKIFEDLGSICPASLRAGAEDDWLRFIVDLNGRLGSIHAYLGEMVDKSRDPFEPILEIVDAPKPLNYVTEIINRAYDDLPDIETQPYLHAIAVRNLLIFLLLCVTCLRSLNLRSLLYKAEGGGQIVLDEAKDGDTPLGLRLHIPWEKFKNRRQKRFFGTADTKRDYERYCHDWWSIAHLFEHYVENCLPLLVDRARRRGDGTVYELLFPDSQGKMMGYDALGEIVRDFTRRYWVTDKVTGRPVEGRMAFGPHAIRDIIATHIVRTAKDEPRWERAADLLQTSVMMVKQRYARQLNEERAAQSDHIFDEQQEGFDRHVHARLGGSGSSLPF